MQQHFRTALAVANSVIVHTLAAAAAAVAGMAAADSVTEQDTQAAVVAGEAGMAVVDSVIALDKKVDRGEQQED